MYILLALGVLILALWLYQRSVKKKGTVGEDEQPRPISDTFMAALKYGREVAVAGESHDNPDGTSRTSIIAQLNPRDMVLLEREPNNKHDGNAILVKSLKGVIGYVNRGDAIEIASWLDRGEKIAAFISSIAGGPDEGKPNYGVWLRVISLEQLPAWMEAKNKH